MPTPPLTAVAVLVVSALPALAAAQAMSTGEVRKIDAAAGKLTLQHAGVASLDLPAMTMVFRVKDPAWLARLQTGEKVRFTAQKIDGQILITAIEPAK